MLDPAPWLGILGLLFLVFSMADLVLTILRLEGPGVLTARVTNYLWSRLALARTRGALSHRLMSYAAPFLLLLMLTFWCGMTWLAWTLIFSGSPGALVDADTGEPAGLEARWAFVGQVLSTLGAQHVNPGGELWATATAVCGLNGFFLLTLSVAYLLPLFQAGACKREAALSIRGLGSSPQAILADKWTETSFRQRLDEITTRIVQQSVNHRAYPVLHFFHSVRVEGSLAVQLARLDEALTLWECVAPEEDRLPRSVFEPLRRAIGEYLETIKPLCQAGVPAPDPEDQSVWSRCFTKPVDPATYALGLEKQRERRSALRAMVEAHGWEWALVWGDAGSDQAVNSLAVHEGVGDLGCCRP